MAVTSEQIIDFLLANPGMSDAEIVSAMEQYGVSPAQMAQAVGIPEGEVASRVAATVPPGQSIILGDTRIVPQYQTIGSGMDQQIGGIENVYVEKVPTSDVNYKSPVGTQIQVYSPTGEFVNTIKTKEDQSFFGGLVDAFKDPVVLAALGGAAYGGLLGGAGAAGTVGTTGLTTAELAQLDLALGGAGGTAGAEALASALTTGATLPTLTNLTGGSGVTTGAAGGITADSVAAKLAADAGVGTGTGLLGSTAGMGGGTGITVAGAGGLGGATGAAGLEGALGTGLTTTGAGLGVEGTGAGITAGTGLTGTGVLTGSALGTGLLGTGTGALTGTGVLTGSTLGTTLLGTGTGTGVTGGVTGLGTGTLGTGALTTGVGTGLTTVGTGLGTGVGTGVGTGLGTTLSGVTTGVGTGVGTGLGTAVGTGLAGTGLGGLTAAQLGSLLSSGLTLGGGLLQQQTSKEAALAAQQRIDAETAAAKAAAQFRPVGMTTRFGTSQFQVDPRTGQITSAGYTLSPEAKAAQDQLVKLAEAGLVQANQAQQQFAPLQTGAQSLFALGNKYLAQNPEQVAQNYMAQQLALLQPGRELELANLQNKLQQQGRAGLSVSQGGTYGATTPELQALYNARAMQEAQLAANAQQAGQQQVQFGAGLLGTGAQTMGQYYAGQQAAYAPYTTALGQVQALETAAQQPLTMGINLGQISSQAGANVGKLGLTGAGQSVDLATGQAATTNPYATVLGGLGASPAFGTAAAGLLGSLFS